MRKLINDYGVEVRAVGADGSLERVKIQFPCLIKEHSLKRASDVDYKDEQIMAALESRGINSELERKNILKAIQLKWPEFL